MPRMPRVHIPGGIHHVMLRGNDGQDIFFGQEYYSRFCQLLGEGVSRYAHRIHAYCLMPNHIHLAIQNMKVSLSKVMHNVAFRYAGWFNHRRNRKGHLFQGRFKAVLVKNDAQLLTVIRYIHLNPVRSQLAKSPSEYPWNSHRAYIDQSYSVSWLTKDLVLGIFNCDESSARRQFADFVTANQDPQYDPFEESEEWYLNEKQSVDALSEEPSCDLTPKLSIEQLEAQVCQTWGLREGALRARRQTRPIAEARGALGWLTMELKNASLNAVAKHLRRDRSTLSVAARRFGDRLQSSKELRLRVEKLLREIEM